MTHPTHDMTEAGCLECGATSIEDLREPCPALATDSDDVWIRARFSEALTALASARAALDAKDQTIAERTQAHRLKVEEAARLWKNRDELIAALDAKDAEIRGWQRVLPGYVDRIAALQSALSEATRRADWWEAETRRILEAIVGECSTDQMERITTIALNRRPDDAKEPLAARSAVSRGEENG